MKLQWVLNDKKVTINCYERHCDLFQWIMNDKMSQFSIMNNIVNDKKGHNIVNDSFAHKPDGLLVVEQ